jgi:hypothetical protein
MSRTIGVLLIAFDFFGLGFASGVQHLSISIFVIWALVAISGYIVIVSHSDPPLKISDLQNQGSFITLCTAAEPRGDGLYAVVLRDSNGKELLCLLPIQPPQKFTVTESITKTQFIVPTS